MRRHARRTSPTLDNYTGFISLSVRQSICWTGTKAFRKPVIGHRFIRSGPKPMQVSARPSGSRITSARWASSITGNSTAGLISATLYQRTISPAIDAACGLPSILWWNRDGDAGADSQRLNIVVDVVSVLGKRNTGISDILAHEIERNLPGDMPGDGCIEYR